MRLLVAIANYGTKNAAHLARLIHEYRNMSFDTHIVVLSEKPKRYADDIEVRVGLPSDNPWSLPFAHKSLFAERVSQYDLFVYSEDDTLLTERSIRAFLDVTEQLPPSKIAGFMRFEDDERGRRYCSTVHSHFHWEPGSVEQFGQYVCAYFTNEHSACFVLTKAQLERAMASNGFLVSPHHDRYDLPCTAATDPYTQCGMRKVVPISHIDDFLLHHLPNRYVGKMGVPLDDLRNQVATLQTVYRSGRWMQQLFPTVKRGMPSMFHKAYYEPPSIPLLESVPRVTGPLLSVGCGWGVTEQAFLEQGFTVYGIPLDSIIASSAQARGVRLYEPDFKQALHQAASQRFRAIICSNVVQHVTDPCALLRELRKVAADDAWIGVTVPNYSSLGVKRRLKSVARKMPESGSWYRETLLQHATAKAVHFWLKNAGWFLIRRRYYHSVNRRLSAHGFAPLFRFTADTLVLVARAREITDRPTALAVCNKR